MVNRFMVDCMHKNLTAIDTAFLVKNQLIAGYVTGSPDVKWTPADWAYATKLGLETVTIDQGFTGSPVPTAVVRDAEAGAWPIDLIIDEAKWLATRPTLYAGRIDMTSLVNQGWKKDIWLAWPMDHIPTKEEILRAHPEYAKANLIGVQIGTTTLYDHSVIYDPYWPNKAPIVEDIMQFPGVPGSWITAEFYDTPHGTVIAGVGTNGDFFYAMRAKGSTTWSQPVHIVSVP